MPARHRQPWFRAKRFGYGAGLPIAWQGWVVLALYLAICIGAPRALSGAPAAGAILAATVWLVWVAKARTRGGWRWRSGRDADG